MLVDSTHLHHPVRRHREPEELLAESRDDEVSGVRAAATLKVARRSLLTLARCASAAGVLGLAAPVLAGSDSSDGANATGDDPTRPLGKIELLDRYTEAPGPGAAGGRRPKEVETNTPFARIDVPFRLTPQWELNFRTEDSGRVDKRSDARESEPARLCPASATCSVRRGSCTTSINAGRPRLADN